MNSENKINGLESHRSRTESSQDFQTCREFPADKIIDNERHYMTVPINIVKEFNHAYFQTFKCREQIEDSLVEDDIFNQKETRLNAYPEREFFKLLSNYFVLDKFNFEQSCWKEANNHTEKSGMHTDHLSYKGVST